MKSLITQALEVVIYIIAFSFIVGGTAIGAKLAGNMNNIPIWIGAIAGFTAGFVFTAVTVGPIVLLMEIRDNTKAAIEKK
jgi:hypothetical protein